MIVCDTVIVGDWVAKRIGGIYPVQGSVAIGQVQNGQLTAGVLYDHYHKRSIAASMAVEPKAILTKAFIWAIFDYPFNQLEVSKIIARASSGNKKSVKMLKKMGFTEEARIAGAYRDGDMVFMTLTKDDCIWIKRLENGKLKRR